MLALLFVGSFNSMLYCMHLVELMISTQ